MSTINLCKIELNISDIIGLILNIQILFAATLSSPVYNLSYHENKNVHPKMCGLKELFEYVPGSDKTMCPESQDEESSEEPIDHLPDSTSLSSVHLADNSSSVVGIHPAYLANAALFNIPGGSVSNPVDVVEEETEIIENALNDLLKITNKSPVSF